MPFPASLCVFVPLITARQRGLLFSEARDRTFSAGTLTEESSGPPPPSQTEAQYCLF
jgi:hypothetical protein